MKPIDIDLSIKELALGALPLLFLFQNGIYYFVCVLTFYILFYLLQQKNKPGVFTFIMAHHMIQIVAGVLLCNYLGEDINFRSPNTSTAIFASAIGLGFLFIPIIYFQSKLPNVSKVDMFLFAKKLSTERVLKCYLVCFFISSFLGAIAFGYAGLTQVIISFIKIKWLFFLLFAYLSIVKKEKRRIFYLAIMLEFTTGFLSYFSEFKSVIFFLLVLMLSMVEKITVRQFFLIVIISFALVSIAVVWTGIKTEYRSFVNKGENSQTVKVSREEALNKLYELSGNVKEGALNSNIFQSLDRLQYTYFFALTIDRVPSVLPHTNGENWMNNILFVTTPRFLNPDKPMLEATEKTKKYTGKMFAGFKQGTSFSLGYFAECYVDFGLEGMIIPLLMIGFIFGFTYYYLMRNASRNIIFNYAVVGAFFMEFYPFEMDGTYMLGRFLANLATFIVLVKLVFPYLLDYISINQRSQFAPGLRV